MWWVMLTRYDGKTVILNALQIESVTDAKAPGQIYITLIGRLGTVAYRGTAEQFFSALKS